MKTVKWALCASRFLCRPNLISKRRRMFRLNTFRRCDVTYRIWGNVQGNILITWRSHDFPVHDLALQLARRHLVIGTFPAYCLTEMNQNAENLPFTGSFKIHETTVAYFSFQLFSLCMLSLSRTLFRSYRIPWKKNWANQSTKGAHLSGPTPRSIRI